jgi:hypothetical protein
LVPRETQRRGKRGERERVTGGAGIEGGRKGGGGGRGRDRENRKETLNPLQRSNRFTIISIVLYLKPYRLLGRPRWVWPIFHRQHRCIVL